MPFYRFRIDAPAPPQVVIERIRAVVGEKHGLFGFSWWGLDKRNPDDPPFFGTTDGDSFRIERDIRYRNSFLPTIWGRVASIPSGTRLSVVMSLNPLVAVFMLLILGAIGYNALSSASAHTAAKWFAFLVGFCSVCFFPEAIIAKRLLSAAILGPESERGPQPLG